VSTRTSILKLPRIGHVATSIFSDAEMMGAWGQECRILHRRQKVRLDGSEPAWMDRYFGSFGATIAGGASEIQRNIIAERILGFATLMNNRLEVLISD